MNTQTGSERIDILPREPRCRICRDPELRRLVNELLGWRGVPMAMGPGKNQAVTYASILRELEPVNEGRHRRGRITYDALWNHAKRHYDLAGVADHWGGRIFGS